MRDQLLNGELFYTLKEAQIIIERWRIHYNTVRPHSSPVGTFADNCSGTYAVRQDGSFITHVNCAGTDGSYTLTGLQFKGQISPDGSVWTGIAAEPVVTTLTLNNGFTIKKRICGAHATAVRIRQQ